MRTLSHYHTFQGGSQDSHVTDMWQSCYTDIPQSKQEALLARETFLAHSQFLKVISDEPEDSIMPHFQCVICTAGTPPPTSTQLYETLCPGLSLSAAVWGFFVHLYIFYLNFHALLFLSAYPPVLSVHYAVVYRTLKQTSSITDGTFQHKPLCGYAP